METKVHRAHPGDEYFFREGCYILESWNTVDDPALSIAQARVAPGKSTRWHRLDGVTERYLITAGTGLAEVGSAQGVHVSTGDVVLIPAGERQRITNTGDGDLILYALCTPRYTPDCYEDLD